MPVYRVKLLRTTTRSTEIVEGVTLLVEADTIEQATELTLDAAYAGRLDSQARYNAISKVDCEAGVKPAFALEYIPLLTSLSADRADLRASDNITAVRAIKMIPTATLTWDGVLFGIHLRGIAHSPGDNLFRVDEIIAQRLYRDALERGVKNARVATVEENRVLLYCEKAKLVAMPYCTIEHASGGLAIVKNGFIQFEGKQPEEPADDDE